MRKLYISALLAMSSLSLFAQKSTWADNIRISGFAMPNTNGQTPKIMKLIPSISEWQDWHWMARSQEIFTGKHNSR